MWSSRHHDDSQASSNNIYLPDSPEEISQLTQTQHSVWLQPEEEEEEEELAPAEQYQYGVSLLHQQEDDEMMMPPPPQRQNYMYEQQQQQQHYFHEEEAHQQYFDGTNPQQQEQFQQQPMQQQQQLHHSQQLENYDPPSPRHLFSPPHDLQVNNNTNDDEYDYGNSEYNDDYPNSQGQNMMEQGQGQSRILSQQSSSHQSTQVEPVSLSMQEEDHSQHDDSQPQQPALDVLEENDNYGIDAENNSDSSSTDSDDDEQSLPEQLLSPAEVIRRIEALVRTIVEALANQQLPEMNTYSTRRTRRRRRTNHNSNNQRRFIFHNMTNCRTFSNILLVLSFCHNLLQSQRTTTTREVYYFYVTHFRNQKECDAAIVEAAKLLRVPRSSLGLFASPRGWFCGCIQILREGRVVMDGQALSSIQGAPITQEWLHPESQREFTIDSQEVPQQQQVDDNDDDDETARMLMEDGTMVETQASSSSTTTRLHRRRAKCILVIEKEGVYNRFSEDRLYERFPCILVTGKGFPDLATRSFVHTVHQQLQLPVYGIADCNPYGVLVLYTYQHGSDRIGLDGGSRYSVPIQWLGLRPSQVAEISASNNNAADDNDDGSTSTVSNNNPTLPPGVYQELTDLDRKRLAQLLSEDHKFHGCGANQDRYEELEIMEENGYKVELESLNWLGMDYMARWVFETLTRHDEYLDRVHEEEQERNRLDHDDDEHGDNLSDTGRTNMDHQSNARDDKSVASLSLSSNHRGEEQGLDETRDLTLRPVIV